MTQDRPEPYDADRHRWMIPGWVRRIGLPRGAGDWFVAALGTLFVVAAISVLWRRAVEHPLIALLTVTAAWWLADRWYRSRWTVEQERRDRLATLSWTLDELDEMSWQDFEFAVRDLMRRDGIAADHVGGPGDCSCDVLGFDPDLGERWMVQVKKYGPKTKVGSEDVQKVAGAAWPVYQANLTLVVTTNTFTGHAREFAALADMHLIDRERLTDWACRGIRLHDVLDISPQTRRQAS